MPTPFRAEKFSPLYFNIAFAAGARVYFPVDRILIYRRHWARADISRRACNMTILLPTWSADYNIAAQVDDEKDAAPGSRRTMMAAEMNAYN